MQLKRPSKITLGFAGMGTGGAAMIVAASLALSGFVGFGAWPGSDDDDAVAGRSQVATVKMSSAPIRPRHSVARSKAARAHSGDTAAVKSETAAGGRKTPSQPVVPGPASGGQPTTGASAPPVDLTPLKLTAVVPSKQTTVANAPTAVGEVLSAADQILARTGLGGR